MPYALLQLSLDQTIDREELEEASVVAPSVARADCALLQRELFGVVVASLEHQEALALQAALRDRSFPTEIVEQSALPVLPSPKRGHALKLIEAGVVLVDMYGREQFYPKEQFMFAAAGHVLHLKNRPYQRLEWVAQYLPRGGIHQAVQRVTDHRLEDVPEFRLEFFFAVEPPRLQWILVPDAVLNVNGVNLRFRDRHQLDSFLLTLRDLLPSDRVNLRIKKSGAEEDSAYPSVRAFEEEIVWSFFQLARGAR